MPGIPEYHPTFYNWGPKIWVPEQRVRILNNVTKIKSLFK